MSSGFITRVEHDKDEPYTVIFTTDDECKYKAIEDACRFAIGHGKLQFQEVVRCKDCKWFDRAEPSYPYGYCHAAKHGYMTSRWEISIYRKCKEDFFCADGEEQNDEQID